MVILLSLVYGILIFHFSPILILCITTSSLNYGNFIKSCIWNTEAFHVNYLSDLLNYGNLTKSCLWNTDISLFTDFNFVYYYITNAYY